MRSGSKGWLGLAGVLLLLGAACAQQTETTPGSEAKPTFPAGSFMAELQKKGKIVIGTKFDLPQIGYMNPATLQAEGFEVDIGKHIASKLGVKPEFIEAVSANREPFLENDRVDLIISTMTITESRKQRIDFSIVYYVAGQTLLVKQNSDVANVKDLDRLKAPVCSGEGSTSEKNIRVAAPGAPVLLHKLYSECFQLLQNDQVKAVTTDDVILLQFVKRDPKNYKLTGGRFSLEPYGMGIKKGRNDFREFVDGVIKEMKTDGTWVRLYDEWIKPVTGQSANAPPDDVKAVAPTPTPTT